MHAILALALASLSAAAPSTEQHVLGPDLAISKSGFKCDLPPVVSPKEDGLSDAKHAFGTKAAFMKQVERHAALVQVPSISYDDLGEVDEDPRWLVFFDFHKELETQFPTVYARHHVRVCNM